MDGVGRSEEKGRIGVEVPSAFQNMRSYFTDTYSYRNISRPTVPELLSLVVCVYKDNTLTYIIFFST